eukprot:scaffold2552_cov172-Alexandrium_tamarense.AAC.1
MPDLPTSPFVMSNDALDRQCNRFHELFNQYLTGKGHTVQPMTEVDYDQRVTFLKMLNSGSTSMKELRKTYPRAYDWMKRYDLIVFGTSEKLVFKADASVPLDKRRQVLHRHRVAKTFHKACADRYGTSAPAWATDLLCTTCPVCISKNKRKKQKAGHTPLITRGFQARGQIDLIDMQSTPDGEFRFILSYRCHGTKFCWLEPLRSKEKKSVAWALFCIFTVLGPPAILQADNGREFNGAACGGKAKQVDIDDEFVDGVIIELKHFWPNCNLVRGKARHSESNGGIERLHLSAETKIGNWMVQTGQTHWSVGCKLTAWEMNTQMHLGIGGQLPYRMVFGQDPRAGISGLAVDADLLSSLRTEAEIVSMLNLRRDIPLEEHMLGGETAISSLHAELVGEEGGDVDDEGQGEGGGEMYGEGEEGGEEDGEREGGGEEDGEGDEGGEEDGEGDERGEEDGDGDEGGEEDGEGDGRGDEDEDDSAGKGGDEEVVTEETTRTVFGGKKKILAEDIPFIPRSVEDLAVCSDVRGLWLNLLSKSDSIVDKELLLRAKINSKFAIVDRKDMSSPWRRVVMQKLRNDVWVLIDEFGDGELARVQSTEDEGPVQEWGLYYRHPTVFDFVAAKSAVLKRNMEQSEAEDKLNESPTRKRMRDDAVVALQAQGRTMKARAAKVVGSVELGSIFQIPLSDVDTVKIDGKVLTVVVVEKVGEGPINGLYHRSYLTPLPEATKELMGLDTIFTTWKGKAPITVREAARAMSMMGGQGMRNADGKKQYCGCKKGSCRTKQCVCFVAQRLCGSRCHGGHNPKCKNNTND